MFELPPKATAADIRKTYDEAIDYLEQSRQQLTTLHKAMVQAQADCLGKAASVALKNAKVAYSDKELEIQALEVIIDNLRDEYVKARRRDAAEELITLRSYVPCYPA